MTGMSKQAAQDEVNALELGVANAQAKADELRSQAKAADADAKQLGKDLAAARRELAAAEKRDHQADAESAEATGST